MGKSTYTVNENVEVLYSDKKWYPATITEVLPSYTYKIKWASSGTVAIGVIKESDIRLSAADAAKKKQEETIKLQAQQQQLQQQTAQAKADEDARKAKAVEDARLAKEAEEKKKRDAEQFAKFEAARKVKEAEEKKKMEENARLAREREQKLTEEANARNKKHAAELSSPSVGLYTYQAENNPGKLVRGSSLGLYSNNGFGKKCNLSKKMQSPSIGMYTHVFGQRDSNAHATNIGGKHIETHK